ncbi:acyl carrier protein [Streptomyces iconiensis]|uniref:Acyl carrier protein n=1 Tax=Streptomyces iconiensis TaxID=1384038 RepID=A0ABT6ZN57_9ACTN|nr:acyl carrier protein [Streptomyces iconiensis]MDJ1130486.1 acyl carrier protein [Streptomyces iconiensis]
MTDINEVLTRCLTDGLGLPADGLHPEATFDDLGLDSLALLELAVIYEDKTGHEPTGLTALSTLAQATALLASHQADSTTEAGT